MALRGNLTDLPIGNIFQMIFMEKKGGKLAVVSGTNRVEIFFEKGKFLLAEQGKEIDFYRLKRVLVSNRYIDESRWVEIVKKREETMQPIWVLLGEIIERNTYHYIIQRQVEHVLFSLLQWSEGEYEFDVEATFHLDRRLFRQIDGEFLLMEVYRAIDEWNEMSTSLPSNSALLAKNEANSASGYQLSENEEYILSIVAGQITFGEILESSQVNIAETAKIVVEMLEATMLLEEEAFLREKRGGSFLGRSRSFAKLIPVLTMSGLLLSSVLLHNFLLPSKQFSIKTWRGKIDRLSAKKRLWSIHKGVIYFSSLYGKLPESTYDLVEKGYVTRRELLDPWGRNIVLQTEGNTYSLFSQGANPEDPADNISIHPLSREKK